MEDSGQGARWDKPADKEITKSEQEAESCKPWMSRGDGDSGSRFAHIATRPDTGVRGVKSISRV